MSIYYGGPNNDHDWLQHLPQSDVWFKEYVVPNTYRGSYVFAVDVPYLSNDGLDGCAREQAKESRTQRLAILGHLQLDPLSPKTLIQNTHHTQRNESVVDLNPQTNTKINTSPVITTHALFTAVFSTTNAISMFTKPPIHINKTIYPL